MAAGRTFPSEASGAARAQGNRTAPRADVGHVLRQPDLFDPERAAQWDAAMLPSSEAFRATVEAAARGDSHAIARFPAEADALLQSASERLHPRARRADPATSHAAAAKAAGFAVNHRNRIAAALATPGTCKEIAARLGDLDHVAVARRLPELQELGLAEPTAERRCGCRVWRRTS